LGARGFENLLFASTTNFSRHTASIRSSSFKGKRGAGLKISLFIITQMHIHIQLGIRPQVSRIVKLYHLGSSGLMPGPGWPAGGDRRRTLTQRAGARVQQRGPAIKIPKSGYLPVRDTFPRLYQHRQHQQHQQHAVSGTVHAGMAGRPSPLVSGLMGTRADSDDRAAASTVGAPAPDNSWVRGSALRCFFPSFSFLPRALGSPACAAGAGAGAGAATGAGATAGGVRTGDVSPGGDGCVAGEDPAGAVRPGCDGRRRHDHRSAPSNQPAEAAGHCCFVSIMIDQMPPTRFSRRITTGPRDMPRRPNQATRNARAEPPCCGVT
jgi:hypothetical protein